MAGVQELPEDDQDLLATIAREDDDPRVRRLAVSKLGSVAVLAERIRSDADPQVREEAAGVLLDIALGAYEADEAASLAAVDGLAGLPAADAQKQLVLVAKSARLGSVARRALDGTGGDTRALGTIARRSEHADIRLEALNRLSDPQEIGAIAFKSDYKDVALAAVERVEDPETLRAVAARAKSPAAQRRARSMVRVIDERDAAAAAAETRRQAVLEARRQAQRDLCRVVEALVAPADWQVAPARLADAESRWSSFGDEVEPDLLRRFREACAAAHEALARRQAEQADRERQERERAEQAARRADLCARIESLPADQVGTSLEPLKAEWTAMPGNADPRLAARFEAACRAADERAQSVEAIAGDIERLRALCSEAESLADTTDAPSSDLRSQWKTLRDRWRQVPDLARSDSRAADLVERWSSAEARMRSRESDVREARAREARELESRAARAAEALERLVDREDVTLKAVEHALRTARTAAEAVGRLEPSPERGALRDRLDKAHSAIAPKAHALREADDWQRWANAAVQEQLCGRMEALGAVEDPAQAVRGLRDLQLEWQKVALGPRDGGQALWRRFVAARDQVRARTDAFVAEQAQQRAANLQRKQALCERAEALAESTDWIRTADAVKALQAEWKTIGPGPRRGEQAVWERFRAACDRFFSRRHEDLAQRKQVWTANLALKESLCARAEALAGSEDWEATAAEFKRLQAEWKTVGPVRRSKSEALWQRFHAACDRFFERYKGRHEGDRAARLGDVESLVTGIEALAASDEAAGDGASDPLAAMRQLRARWDARPALPRDVLGPLKERVEAALESFARNRPDAVRGSELDVAANVQRLETLCSRAEQLARADTESAPAASPAAILASQLREALAANTIGGKGDAESRRGRTEQEARQLQSAWESVGFVPEAVGRRLAERFRKALRRTMEQGERRVPVGRG